MAELNHLIQLVRSQLRDKEGIVFSLPKPAVGDVLGEPDELEPFVLTVVADYSRWRPLNGKPGLLTLQVGTTDYMLPEDLIEIQTFSRDFTRFERMIFLNSPPLAPEEVRFYYSAMHTPETVPAYDVPAIVGMATASALRAVASDPKKIEEYISFKLEGVLDIDTQNTSEVIKGIMKMATELEEQYLLRVQQQTSQMPVGPFMSFG